MKSALLSMVALAALAGVQAAQVEGNNTAVVIRRDNVASDTGHHLLCVPVAPLSISGPTANGGTPLETLLPAALYPEATVTLNSESQTDSAVYVSDGSKWTKEGSGETVTAAEDTATEQLLFPGQVIWLSNPADKSTVTDETGGKPIVFCGEQNEAMADVSTEDGLHSIGNATSDTKKLSEIFVGTYGKGTQILSIAKRGDAEYTRYYYYGPTTGWKKFTPNGIYSVDITTIDVHPGEAVYYFAKPGETVAGK